MKKGISLTWKLALGYMALIVLSVSLVAMAGLRIASNVLVENASQHNQDALRQAKSNVNMLLENMVERLNTLRVDQAFMNAFRKYSGMERRQYEAELIASSAYLDDYHFLKQRLASNAASATLVDYYMLVAGEGGVGYASWGNISQDLTDYLDTCRQLFAENNGQVVWLSTRRTIADAPYFADDTQTFSAVKQVVDYPSGKSLGYMMLSIGEKNLASAYHSLLQMREGSLVYMLDSEGSWISGVYDQNEETFPLVAADLAAHADQQKGSFFSTIDGTRYLVSYDTIARNGWRIAYLTPFEQMRRPVRELISTVLLVIAGAFLLAFLLSLLISRSVSLRLNSLREVMLAQGDAGPMRHAPVSSQDEIGKLAVCYNQMADRINQYASDLVEEQNKKREMELSFLQMEINSHFLYNTLNSIKILVRINMVERIEGLVTALIKLLRLTSSRSDLITIEEELENVRHYVTIQQIRYLDRFEVEYCYGDWAKDCLIPKLLLQPVIENAIIHGALDREDTTYIRVALEKENGEIRVVIEDNGRGMQRERLEAVMMRKAKMNGIGLPNIDERIKLYFGRQYGLEITSAPGAGTRVVLHIGVLPAEGGDTEP